MPLYKSYAKLNLSLGITGLLENGYHSVDMIMQEINLHDVITIEESNYLRVECGNICSEEKNTAYRAAQLFFDFIGIPAGAHITIEKHIPTQAGLGGGSSNAATVLAALNGIYGAGLPDTALRMLSAEIGMDVPFFIKGGCARARGRGEELAQLVNNCAFEYLLVKPEGGIDTKEAYRLHDTLSPERIDIDSTVSALSSGEEAAYFKSAGNALYRAAARLDPGIAQLKNELDSSGAEFSMMTGSGSCVFAVYENKKALAGAYDRFLGRYPFVCKSENLERG